MTFAQAVELFIADMRVIGRLTTDRSADEYCRALLPARRGRRDRRPARHDTRRRHADAPSLAHPNTQRRRRSMLVSFDDWMVEEGLRPDNPARQTRAARESEPTVHRLTLEETRRFLAAARAGSERRIAYLGVCAGLRRNEMRPLRGRHFAREGWIWIPPELAKGGRERWVPVIGDLEPVVQDIREAAGPEDHVLPATVWVAGDRGLRRCLRRSGPATPRRSGAPCAGSVAGPASRPTSIRICCVTPSPST
jgi:hypothetical protein